MRYLFFILIFVSSMSYGQEPIYTPMKGNYKFKGIKCDTLFLIPSFSDTTAANATYLDQVAGSMIRCGNDFWMRNEGATAWLQNVNVGSGASSNIQYVDSIYRKLNSDSIYWRKGGFIYKFKESQNLQSVTSIKDSTTNSIVLYDNYQNPNFIQLKSDYDTNRIKLINQGDDVYMDFYQTRSSGYNTLFFNSQNGSTTLEIKNGGGENLFNSSGKFIVQSDGIQLIPGNKPIDHWGQDYWSNNTLDTAVTYNFLAVFENDTLKKANKFTARRNLNLSSGNDTIKAFGTYMISTADSTNTLFLPNAANYSGMTIYIINKDSVRNQKIGSLGGSIYDASAVTLTKVYSNKFAIFTSDGTDWYGYNTQ